MFHDPSEKDGALDGGAAAKSKPAEDEAAMEHGRAVVAAHLLFG